MDERTEAGGRLKLLPHLARLLALSPILAAGVWTSFASRLPEPFADRRARGEVSMRLDLADWNHFDDEPMHTVARGLHNALFEIPGLTFQIAALLNALLAAGVVMGFAGLLRRTFVLSVGGHALALAVAGLLVCTPAFGADWLHVERAGLFGVPLLLFASLLLLHRDGALWWRGLIALVFAATAPFLHGNGMFVFVALLPAFVDAARRANARPVAWVIACLIVGNVAAAVSLSTAVHLALDGTGLVGRIAEAPLSTLQHLLVTTGGAWPDPLPNERYDNLALGALSWLAPLVLWRLGDRSDAARRAAAPWWGCLWLGLLLPLWLLERHGVALAPSALRELGFGAFVLPAGVVGVTAARFGKNALAVAAGAALALGVQDWHCGLEALRNATMKVRGLETAVLLPDVHAGERPVAVLPVRFVADWTRLVDRHHVPVAAAERRSPSAMATESPAAPMLGSFAGGDAKQVHGTVRSSMFGDPVQCVWIVEQSEGKAPEVIGRVQPRYEGHERTAQWTAVLDRAPAAGAVVGAYGYRPDHDETVLLGPRYTVRDGVLVATP